MLVNLTVQNVVEAQEEIERLELQGYTRDNIYVFTHSKDSTQTIAESLNTEEVDMEEQGFLGTVKNLFNTRGDEIRDEMEALGLSQEAAEQAERELDEGKMVVLAKRTL